MKTYVRHTYHMVQESPWPVMSSMMGLFLTVGLISWFHMKSMHMMKIGLMCMMLIMYQWWRDVSMEASKYGYHTMDTEKSLRMGMVLFISSEVLFFVSFFWAFFHSSLAPAIELGGVWPPSGIEPFNPFQIPLLNTIVLLSSGVTVTWSHHSIMEGNHSEGMKSIILTITLGVYFTMLQMLEYYEASFTLADSVYGSTFFIATGFHGLHVIVGSLFLFVAMIRMGKGEYSPSHHFGFESAAWYWHFVDVVWLFLFMSVYWWGGN